MKVIEDLSEDIECILGAADDYMKKAIQYQQDFPAASKVYYNKSVARMNDVKDLHDQIVAIINTYKAEKGEPPAPMMAVYNYMHKRQMDMSARVKAYQDLYK